MACYNETGIGRVQLISFKFMIIPDYMKVNERMKFV